MQAYLEAEKIYDSFKVYDESLRGRIFQEDSLFGPMLEEMNKMFQECGFEVLNSFSTTSVSGGNYGIHFVFDHMSLKLLVSKGFDKFSFSPDRWTMYYWKKEDWCESLDEECDEDKCCFYNGKICTMFFDEKNKEWQYYPYCSLSEYKDEEIYDLKSVMSYLKKNG